MKELQFVQGVGVRLTVYAAEFAPDERDKTAYKWEDASGSHKMDMPPYCLANLERIKPNVCQYIEQSSFLYLRQLQHTNDIIWDHILMASRYAEKRRVGCANVLDYWLNKLTFLSIQWLGRRLTCGQLAA